MRYYLVDAFTDRLFSGNPAGVCLADRPLSPELMQRIAGENNLPETAFLEKGPEGWHIRWFTRPLRWICAATPRWRRALY